MRGGGGVAPPRDLASALTDRLAQPVAAHEGLGLDPAPRTCTPVLVVVAGPVAGPSPFLLAE
eukprot:13789435-Alexandrium_andersonii.AAC.1